MPTSETVYREDTVWARTLQGVCAIGLVVGLLIAGFLCLTLSWSDWPGILIPLAGSLVCSLGCLYAGSIVNDDGPKLIVNSEGLTDYRRKNGPRQIAWNQVRSLDTEVFSVNGTAATGCLNFYVVEGGKVEAVKVAIGHLDKEPGEVIKAVKLAMIAAQEELHQHQEEPGSETGFTPRDP